MMRSRFPLGFLAAALLLAPGVSVPTTVDVAPRPVPTVRRSRLPYYGVPRHRSKGAPGFRADHRPARRKAKLRAKVRRRARR